jgi:hypothetical protein
MLDALAANARVDTSEIKGRCFIATAVYGEGVETRTLRRFRDAVLRKTAPGRWTIGVYYRIGPSINRLLAGSARWRAVIRLLLKPAVPLARLMIDESDPS